MSHLVASVLAGAALALTPAAPALASTPATPVAHPAAPAPPLAHPAAPATNLRLTVTAPTPKASGTRSVTLQCDPDGGTHPKAAQACAELARHGGQFTHRPADVLCTMIYAPVVADASGHWRGRMVHFHQQFPNDCDMHARTGTVFDF
jgi:hypothetical protein